MAHVFVLEEPKLTVFSLRNTNKTLPRELHFLQFVLVFLVCCDGRRTGSYAAGKMSPAAEGCPDSIASR